MVSAGFWLWYITDFARNIFLENGLYKQCIIFGIKHLLKIIIFYVFKKPIDQIYQNMCQLICKFVEIAYTSVQNMPFYN